jgi:hypothetical protein
MLCIADSLHGVYIFTVFLPHGHQEERCKACIQNQLRSPFLPQHETEKLKSIEDTYNTLNHMTPHRYDEKS